MRRDFDLAVTDTAFLDELGLPWETLRDQGGGWIWVHDFPVPAGLKPDQTTLAVRLEAPYPDCPLDMAYFHPAIQRIDGRPIAALAQHMIDGKPFQRWSRHRSPANPWRPGLDDLSTHIALVRNWLDRELER